MSYFFSFLFLIALQAQAETLKILSSSSMTGPRSLGEFLESEFPKFCSDCAVRFSSTHEMGSLMGRLRKENKSKGSEGFHAVMGLDSQFYKLASNDQLVKNGVAYDQSPMAFVVDTQRFPKKDWPKKWAELSQKLSGEILISDPRLSSPGFMWIKSLFRDRLLSLEASKKLVRRVFPSWSSAYSAFLKGEGKAIWTYQSSEAYHRCNEKTIQEQERYLALPLEEGYPVQIEYFAETHRSKSTLAKKFSEFLLSKKIQEKISTLNWMFPISSEAEIAPCFKKTTPLKVAPLASQNFTQRDVQSWIDQWAL